MNKMKAVIAMSGGVDSSVAALLMKNEGYTCVGATMQLYSEGDCSDAKAVADKLGMPFYIFPLKEEFKKQVIDKFIEFYEQGKTPNPCIVCNPHVKFATLIKTADELGIGYIATGHYAQVEKVGETYFVKKAVSVAKDQSYMLYRLPQEILSRLILPIGSYEKPEIREMAGELELFNADKPDSQEICFIPDGNYGEFIKNLGYKTKYGWLMSPEGKRLRRHEGVHNFTVGQRKGLGVALGKPAFVKEITEKGDVLLGYAGEEFFSGVELSSPVYANGYLEAGTVFTVKIRSASKGDEAKAVYCDDEKIVLEFVNPVRAAAKGQSVVIYTDNYVVAGGFIENAIK